MSCKSALSNSVRSNCEPPVWMKGQATATAAAETNVKLAGDEAKDRLYEPKHKRKAVRVLTVVAYVISVSLAAIMLSLYYMFIWNPPSVAKLNNQPNKLCIVPHDSSSKIVANQTAAPATMFQPEKAPSWQGLTTPADPMESQYEISSAEAKRDDDQSNDIPRIASSYETESENSVSNETLYE